MKVIRPVNSASPQIVLSQPVPPLPLSILEPGDEFGHEAPGAPMPHLPSQARLTREGMLSRLRHWARERNVADADAVAQRFRREDRARLRRFASASFAHVDVAIQFPMLAFLLAGRLLPSRQRLAAGAAIARGETLVRIARLAGVPMWMRAIPASGCMDPNGPLPDSADFACRISDVLRKRLDADLEMRGLLRSIAGFHAAAGEELALWFAARHPEGCMGPELSGPMRMLVLWYLLGKCQPCLGRDLIQTHWTKDLSLETALRAAKNFTRRIDLELLVGPQGVVAPWFPRTQLMDLDFVPLLTSTEIRAEARLNENCVDWYGRRLATREVGLWSVRTADGRRVANIEVSAGETLPKIPRIAQIKAPKNDPAEPYVSAVADIWLNRQIREHGLPDMRRRPLPAPNAARWQEIVAPLAATGVLPSWAQACPTNRELAYMEIEFTLLGSRLQTRGWRFA